MRDGFEKGCADTLSEVQRTCLMVVPGYLDMRWCAGDGPQQCERASAHILGLIEAAGLSASEMKQARIDIDYDTHACLAGAAITDEVFECIMRAKTAEAHRAMCRYGSRSLDRNH